MPQRPSAAATLDPNARLTAVYRVRAAASEIEARARAIAVEQSVEMPVEAIRDPAIRDAIVGAVGAIADLGGGVFEVEIGLATATVGDDAGQLLNMLFGNASLLEDVALSDFRLPEAMLARFPGPALGLPGLRALAGAPRRALTAAALKPQGLPPESLGALAYELALGGVDLIKDDHGIASQPYSPFAPRVAACAGAARRAEVSTGRRACYVPSLSGHFGQMREQIEIAKSEGISCVMVAPMIAGLSTFQGLREAHPDLAFLAHPTMAGAGRISPTAWARLFRLCGGDAVIFPNHGGRFGYSPAACLALADALRQPWGHMPASAPTPAGGMTVPRAPEMLDFYGPDVILLIGGALLLAPPEKLADEAAVFARVVAEHDYGARE
jgi:ribulose-bisphosphate carboxylase large chain